MSPSSVRSSVVLLLALLAAAAGAQEPNPAEGPDPKSIWPAGLEKLAGKYVFVQVASPGGLWERFQPSGKGEPRSRQVSINEVPAALREKLIRAEIVISDLKLPSSIEASERESPSKRGRLRFYSETTTGTLTLRSIPGVGGGPMEKEEYIGPVEFTLDHQGHSNPSVSGVLYQRLQQESTWGAATLDYADLHAVVPAPPERPDEEGLAILGNARVLRAGLEIFAFVDWTQKTRQGEKRFTGSIRLMRREVPTPTPGV